MRPLHLFCLVWYKTSPLEEWRLVRAFKRLPNPPPAKKGEDEVLPSLSALGMGESYCFTLRCKEPLHFYSVELCYL